MEAEVPQFEDVISRDREPSDSVKPLDREAPYALTAAAIASAAMLAACGGGGSSGAGPTSSGGGSVSGPDAPTILPLSAPQASRLLAQATLGASKSDIAAAQPQGAAGWIEAQFAKPQSQSHVEWLTANGYGVDANRDNTTGMDNTVWRKLISSDDALRQRVTLALSELMVASVLGVNTSFRQFAMANYLDILERNAFGNYRTLMGEVTLSTAMGYYLTYRGNAKANTSGSQPDENYARELMQLFTIGLVQLEADGTPKAGAPESYTQADVSGLARVFTGWDLDTTGLTSPYPPELHSRPMIQRADRYETGEKKFLGVTVAAGTTAAIALNTALDTLFNHPNLPPFVSRQLIQRLVMSNPSAAYVGRVADAFRNNGAGARGDMKAVLRAILLDSEARADSIAALPASGKLREPIVRLLNWARAFKATSATNVWAIGDLTDAASRLGQSPLRSPSVFNFFRPGYVPPSSGISQAGLTGPEFQITNESSVVGYINYMQRAINGSGVGDVLADYSSLIAVAADSKAVLDELNLVLAANQLSTITLNAYKPALDTIVVTTDAGKRNRVLAALLLVLAAPEYIVQK